MIRIVLLTLMIAGCVSSFSRVETKTFELVPKAKSKVVSHEPAFSQQWALRLIDWEEYKPKSKKLVVAVIDTGIDANHPDIKGNLWVNSKEIPGNGVDDDKNGCVDDVHGCNFITMNGDLTDNHGHGTHIAGIIGAKTSNNIGIAGMAVNVKLMILKYYDPKAVGANNLLNTVKAIKYAAKMGADIINYSGGGLEYSKIERNAIKKAGDKGILFVAAAGNEHNNSDKAKYYPASYNLSNIISVTAVNPRKRVLASSNYGVKTVDLAAPGENIYSTLPDNSYGLMTGTSQATAFVTGAVVTLKSRFPRAEITEIISVIKYSGNRYKHLRKKSRSGSILNIRNAIENMELIQFIKDNELKDVDKQV